MRIGEKIKKTLLLTGFICLSISAAFAQGPGFDDDVEDTPIDGGVGVVLIAAALYGSNKIKNYKK